MKNSIFEMPIIPQTLSINNLGTTSAKSIDLNTIRKLVEYSLNNLTSMFALTVLEILLFDIITHTAGAGSKRANVRVIIRLSEIPERHGIYNVKLWIFAFFLQWQVQPLEASLALISSIFNLVIDHNLFQV